MNLIKRYISFLLTISVSWLLYPESIYAGGMDEDGLKSQLSHGYSTHLYYDLGNHCVETDDLAGAVYNYELALRLDPGNSPARNNLKYVENLVSLNNGAANGNDNIDTTPMQDNLLDSLKSAIGRVSSNMWAVFALLLFFAFAVSCMVYFCSAKEKVRKLFFFSAWGLLAITCMGIVGSYVSCNYSKRSNEAVVQSGTLFLYSEPKLSSMELKAPLTPGTKVRIIETTEAQDGTKWDKIIYNSEINGWIPEEDLLTITLPDYL